MQTDNSDRAIAALRKRQQEGNAIGAAPAANRQKRGLDISALPAAGILQQQLDQAGEFFFSSQQSNSPHSRAANSGITVINGLHDGGKGYLQTPVSHDVDEHLTRRASGLQQP